MNALERYQVIQQCLLQIMTTSQNELPGDYNLLSIGMDSMLYIRLVVELEDLFNIEIHDDDLLLDNFSTPASIFELINKYFPES
ncbi:phosphopantetheine binding protein [Paenibacillus cellulosilyticus]|uniref:Phosphopantetheine binding protein n=1 Tax=Paenibacillus cellulosilyticus TaxID=375489 RepID=A0A2V2YUA5_9BACL|nr:acyl carrier protein [Paenibacillus cellulosilyticus]PWW03207.1 phosphopantetheine binding protein [Paenibacillus cellulosilyticus]QKS43697.1 acyl carrier protein [Paenibacillus cellulosilyticus]